MKLTARNLRWKCNPKEFEDINHPEGADVTLKVQKRASSAIAFGLEAESEGFNIFAVGEEGVGKKWLVLKKAQEKVEKLPVPNDWCYVFNFKDPQHPRALSLPPGRGMEFKEDMKSFVEHLKEELPKAFESKEYEEKAKEITEHYNGEKERLLKQLAKMAEIAGFTVKFTPTGIALFPLVGGQLVSEDKALTDPKLREFINGKRREFDPIVSDYLKKLKDIDKRLNAELKNLREEVALFVINTVIEDLKEKYRDLPEIASHIDAVKEDILKNIDLFLQLPQASENPFLTLQIEKNLSKYEVNVIVDNGDLQHAPLVYEKNPTYSNLFGKIGVRAEFGLYVTDFTQIVPGSIHKANGGILVLRVKDVLMNPGVWYTLKKILMHREISVQPFWEELGLPHPASSLFKPQPIPLKIKVVLLGDRPTFYLLGVLDPEFHKLFKVKAEMKGYMTNTEDNRRLLYSTMYQLAKNHNLLPLSPSGAASLMEYSARLAGSKNKLSLKIEKLLDLAKEASFYAKEAGKDQIEAEDIDRALEEKIFRSNLPEEIYDELVEDGTLIINPTGKATGQCYGLAVVEFEDYAFGRPVRITATVSAGDKGVVSIERETKLSGRIFEKAILTLSGYLGNMYGKEHPISLTASIAFEQSYSPIEGDSATLAELIALLSAISETPVRQDVAVTGSVDQLGNVQPVGSINEKIEGFYRICKRLGRRGCVIIPRRNVNNLQLEREVITAYRKKRFNIYAVDSVDEALEIAFGLKAKEVHDKVAERLKKLYAISRRKK